ncbi:cache domain-containing protein [Marinobacterium arenosum]|uniref:cache domain-containing protein n=1 Tax=Marinobacterium arenosum TaxID=2862496 RepID=UPI001C93DB35|nr:cache domain-containing protein [Marinobacterium arenosum]MBY4675252.1 cache domain-containing protein [Marinobacterium arenosum]
MPSIPRLLAAVAISVAMPVLATGSQGTPDEALALVKRAVAFYKLNGQQKTMAALNDQQGDFIDRDLYVFVHDDQGIYYAIAPKPKFIGKNLSKVRDAKGKFIVQEQLDMLKSADSMWQEYHWENPVSKKIQLKKTYCEKVDQLHFCSGAYAVN